MVLDSIYLNLYCRDCYFLSVATQQISVFGLSFFYFFKLVHSQSPVKPEQTARTSDNEVVIESGPVEYEKNDEANLVGEEEDFDELEEEDEEPMSAAHLMGHIYDESK